MWTSRLCAVRLLAASFLLFNLVYFLLSPLVFPALLPTIVPASSYGNPMSSMPRPVLTLHHDPFPQLGYNETKAIMQTERRMRTRVAQLREACEKTFQPASRLTTETLNSAARARTVALEEVKLLVCVVYKAGSSAWNFLLAHLYHHTEIIETGRWYKMIDVLKPTYAKFDEMHQSSSEYMRVIMAREPLERLLSAYRDRIQDQSHFSFQAHHYGPLILQAARSFRYSRRDGFHANGTLKIVPTFSEFVWYLVDRQMPQEYDPHWRPIYLLCSLCNLNYTDIVHMETYDEDVHYIMRKTGLIREVDEGLIHKGQHKGRGDTQALLASYYSTLPPSWW